MAPRNCRHGAVTTPQAATSKDAVHNGLTKNGLAPAGAKSAIGLSIFNSPIGAETPEVTEVPEPTERPEATHVPEPTETDRLQTNALQGIVNAITENIWTINGHNIIVDSQIMVINTTGVGNWVMVKAVIQSDGSLLALEINPGTAIALR